MLFKYFSVCIFFIVAFTTASAQKDSKKITITGVVTDSLNNPVKDAVIFLDESIVDKTTNRKGEFKVKVKDLPKIISAYSEGFGFSSSEDFKNNKVAIKFDSTSLKEGKHLDLIALKKLKKPLPEQVFTNVYDYLRVKVPMVRVSGSNEITVRGNYDTTLTSSREPLIIVNGHPTSTDAFADLSPSNIKDVTVLKSSQSASYGVRAANGVILVTTK